MFLKRISTIRFGCALSARAATFSGLRPSRYDVDENEDLSEFDSEVSPQLNTKECLRPDQTRRSKPHLETSRDFPFEPEQEELLSLLETISNENSQSSPLRMSKPSIPSRTFGVTLPPKWAAEVPRRLARLPCMVPRRMESEKREDAAMPLSSRKVYLFQQVFIHPSFVRVEKAEHSPKGAHEAEDKSSELTIENVALRFTNYPLTIQGHALLRTAVTHWAVGLYPNVSAQILNEAVSGDSTSPLLSDECLARIASVDWGIDDLLLGDGKSYEKAIARQKKLATSGGLGSSAAAVSIRPTAHVATIVPSLCAAIYLTHGMDEAMAFIGKNVLPLLVAHARVALSVAGDEDMDTD